MSFEGCWRVREHVFDAQGRALGTVRQRRILEPSGPKRFRLTQHCEPDASLDQHPMANFAGTHVFDLEVDGQSRRYLGPAVLGGGQMLGEGILWGEGIWPVFGHAFQSYSVSLPHKQLTGGVFSNGNALMAQIVGVAQPENDSEEWPELTGPYQPQEISSIWTGTRSLIRPDGSVIETQDVKRQYSDGRWTDHFPGGLRRVQVEGSTATLQIQSQDENLGTTGVSRRCGWSLELEWVEQGGRHVRAFEALDASDGHLAVIHRNYQNLQLADLEVLRLTPEESHE